MDTDCILIFGGCIPKTNDNEKQRIRRIILFTKIIYEDYYVDYVVLFIYPLPYQSIILHFFFERHSFHWLTFHVSTIHNCSACKNPSILLGYSICCWPSDLHPQGKKSAHGSIRDFDLVNRLKSSTIIMFKLEVPTSLNRHCLQPTNQFIMNMFPTLNKCNQKKKPNNHISLETPTSGYRSKRYPSVHAERSGSFWRFIHFIHF